jgi:hypothetical protein
MLAEWELESVSVCGSVVSSGFVSGVSGVVSDIFNSLSFQLKSQ